MAFVYRVFRAVLPVLFAGCFWAEMEGEFVRRYVPELAKFDKKYIYEPWKAPIADQKKWGCRIVAYGEKQEQGTYPKPLFDFAERRDVCLKGMKNAYSVGLYGNDPKVLDGSWRKLFEDDAEGPTTGKKGPPGAMVEHEDADGTEEHDHPTEPPSPKKAKKVAKKSEEKAAGHKREASQGTLDGMVTRNKKTKKEDVFPNETHFG
jgi:hypothetical protein